MISFVVNTFCSYANVHQVILSTKDTYSYTLHRSIFSFVLAFSTQLNLTSICFFRSSFIRTTGYSDGQFLVVSNKDLSSSDGQFLVAYNKDLSVRRRQILVAYNKELSVRVAFFSHLSLWKGIKSYEKAIQMKKVFCFNNCACRVFRTNLVLI